MFKNSFNKIVLGLKFSVSAYLIIILIEFQNNRKEKVIAEKLIEKSDIGIYCSC